MRLNRLFYKQVEFWLGCLIILAGLWSIGTKLLTLDWWLALVEILIGLALVVDCLIDSARQ